MANKQHDLEALFHRAVGLHAAQLDEFLRELRAENPAIASQLAALIRQDLDGATREIRAVPEQPE